VPLRDVVGLATATSSRAMPPDPVRLDTSSQSPSVPSQCGSVERYTSQRSPVSSSRKTSSAICVTATTAQPLPEMTGCTESPARKPSGTGLSSVVAPVSRSVKKIVEVRPSSGESGAPWNTTYRPSPDTEGFAPMAEPTAAVSTSTGATSA